VDLLDAAASESDRAKRATLPEADLMRRQAAEKTWGFVATEVNRLLRSLGYDVEVGPRSHEARKKWLHELDRALGTNLFGRHEEYAELHGSCFYEAKCPPPDVIDGMILEARRFVEDVRAALLEVRHRGARAS
jgi:hypothetical protein